MNDENGKAEISFNQLHEIIISFSNGIFHYKPYELDNAVWRIENSVMDFPLNESLSYFEPALEEIISTQQILKSKSEELGETRYPWDDDFLTDEERETQILIINEILMALDNAALKLRARYDYLQKIIRKRNLLSEQKDQGSQNHKFKLNLSVPEAAALFRILMESEILEVPVNEVEDFAIAITNIFYTKGTTKNRQISPQSFFNHFYNKDHDTLSTWIAKFPELQKKAKELMDIA